MKETSNLSIDVIVVVYDYVTTFGVLVVLFPLDKRIVRNKPLEERNLVYSKQCV